MQLELWVLLCWKCLVGLKLPRELEEASKIGSTFALFEEDIRSWHKHQYILSFEVHYIQTGVWNWVNNTSLDKSRVLQSFASFKSSLSMVERPLCSSGWVDLMKGFENFHNIDSSLCIFELKWGYIIKSDVDYFMQRYSQGLCWKLGLAFDLGPPYTRSQGRDILGLT